MWFNYHLQNVQLVSNPLMLYKDDFDTQSRYCTESIIVSHLHINKLK